MLTKRELNLYRDELCSERRIGLRSIVLLEAAVVRNRRFTSGFIPLKTKSIKNACWADQWMALSEQTSGRFACACCGKLLFADTEDPECKKIAKAYRDSGVISDCTPETLQVQGGHIVLLKNISDNNGYLLAKQGSTHIVSLCKECNNSNVSNIQLAVNTIITPEIR